jgi:hypothetical protein
MENPMLWDASSQSDGGVYFRFAHVTTYSLFSRLQTGFPQTFFLRFVFLGDHEWGFGCYIVFSGSPPHEWLYDSKTSLYVKYVTVSTAITYKEPNRPSKTSAAED